MDTNIIHIAFDKSKKKFVAYNEDTNIFATGVCVVSAVDAYKIKFYEKKETEFFDSMAKYPKI